MSFVSDYLDQISTIDDLPLLAQTTFNHIERARDSIELCLFKHDPSPYDDAIQIREHINLSGKKCLNILFDTKYTEFKQIIKNQTYTIYFSSLSINKKSVHGFLVNTNDSEICLVLKIWQAISFSLEKIELKKFHEELNKQNNLISQILHDFQSIMEISKTNKDLEVLQKLSIQEAINKKLLFYIRDFDLFQSIISVKQLLHDSLAVIGYDVNNFSIQIDTKAENISVDVDLFSMAINEIIQNSLKAVNNDSTQIQININLHDSYSPFVSKNWMCFEFRDQGKGINQDFLPFLKQPFFTTYKLEGHSGFGLSIADKIIKAHNGFIKINSLETGSLIKIEIPLN